MTSKDGDRQDHEMMLILVAQAHALINEFAELPAIERARATELLAQLQNIVSEFRAMRPAPTFRHAASAIDTTNGAKFK